MINELLHPKISKALIDDFKINEFTDIQVQIIPHIIEGKNTIGISQTGSGKTLSYVLPIISQIVDKPKKPIKALVITPTKELAEQILAVFKKAARHTNLICMSLYGGASFNEQVRDLNKGVHIVVACPGRLKDHIEKQTIDLKNVHTVVLDEADQLMDMGFFPAVSAALEAAENRLQTHLFSASMSKDVSELISQFVPNPIRVELQNTKPKESIAEFFCPISPELKYPFLRFLLKHKKIKYALIFTRTKEEASGLGEQLVKDGYLSTILQGDMTTHQRRKSLDSLVHKKSFFLVATDVASRGIDIPHVEFVINYNPPESFEAYVHRIGRTARHDLSGQAYTLFTPEEEMQLKKIFDEKIYKKSKFKEFNYQMKIEKRHIKIF